MRDNVIAHAALCRARFVGAVSAIGPSFRPGRHCSLKFLPQPGPTKPRQDSLKKRLTSRSFLRVALRRCLLSRVQRPCLKLPFRGPDGPPDPFAPPCIRQRARPLTAACRQGRPVRVLAPQRGTPWSYLPAGARCRPDARGRLSFLALSSCMVFSGRILALLPPFYVDAQPHGSSIAAPSPDTRPI